ncbi:MAG: ABC transporter substrate-binding protein [Alphaproteobacteria bacterium]|nr:ABC transporter substrate-binding protein [Alphaproteobacteria bacterium]
MKKLSWKGFIAWGIVILTIGFVICFNMQKQKALQTPDKRNVYAMLPLTGEFAQYGKDIQYAMEIYMQQKDLPFSVRYIDSEGNPMKAVTALQQETLNDPSPIVISVFTHVAAALAPVVEQKNGFLFATACVAITTKSHSYQRMSQPAEAIMDVISPFIIKNYKKINIVYTQDDHGLEELESLKRAFKGTSVEVGKEIPVALTTRDVRIEALKLTKENPEAIIVIGRTTQGYINIIKEIKNLGYKGKIIADSGLSNPPILNALGEYANDLILSTMIAEVEMPQPEKVIALKNELARDGKKIYFVLVESLDTLDLIRYTLDHNLPFEQATYENLKTWNGISGNIKFLKNGDYLSSAYTMATIKDGKIVPIEE